MPTVRIPSPLRKVTDGQAEVVVDGRDLRTVVDNVEAAHPGFGARVLDESGELRRFVNVFVRDEDVRFQEGLDTELREGDVVSIVPAVAGGAERRRGSGVASTHGAGGSTGARSDAAVAVSRARAARVVRRGRGVTPR